MKQMLLAMWSGPRNISTAMMRSWENRADTSVIDEPFYGFYLKETGIDHPMAPDIINSMDTRWETIVENISNDGPHEANIYYQKHITTHMLPGVDLAWTDRLVNCFLLRDPARVVASYARKRVDVCAADLGFEQQVRVFDHVRQHNVIAPIAIDSDQFLQQPEATLRSLCEKLGIAFDGAMLQWPSGKRDSDGIWAAHWYDAVESSSGFKPWTASTVSLEPSLQAIADECQPAYDRMLEYVLDPG